MISAIASRPVSFCAHAAVSNMAQTTAILAIPILMFALTAIPGVEARKPPTMGPGPQPESPYVQCMNACIDNKVSAIVTLLCQIACALFAKKQPGEL
jgi:hypothetical protein